MYRKLHVRFAIVRRDNNGRIAVFIDAAKRIDLATRSTDGIINNNAQSGSITFEDLAE